MCEYLHTNKEKKKKIFYFYMRPQLSTRSHNTIAQTKNFPQFLCVKNNIADNSYRACAINKFENQITLLKKDLLKIYV